VADHNAICLHAMTIHGGLGANKGIKIRGFIRPRIIGYLLESTQRAAVLIESPITRWRAIPKAGKVTADDSKSLASDIMIQKVANLGMQVLTESPQLRPSARSGS
jgi:hypothetical protein